MRAHVVQVWHIWCLSFTVGLAQSFGGPAYSALIPTLVKKEDLQNAIALNSIQFNLARVVGPALGGLALVKLGAFWCFTLNGISYLAVIATLLAIRSDFVPAGHAGCRSSTACAKGSTFCASAKAWRAWWCWLSESRCSLIPSSRFCRSWRATSFMAEQTRSLCSCACRAPGSVTGALLVAGSASQSGQARKSLIVMAVLGVVITAFGLSRVLAASAVLVFVSGSLLMIVFALNTSMVQLYVSDTMRGRVMSVYNVAFRGGMPLGSLVSGLLIKADVGACDHGRQWMCW